MKNPCKHENIERLVQYDGKDGQKDGQEMWWCNDCGSVKFVDLQCPTVSGRWRAPRVLKGLLATLPEALDQELRKLAL